MIPLYVLANLIDPRLCAACTVLCAATRLRSRWLPRSALAALYLMINPTKASYSVAPTMMVCALAGFLTAKLFADSRGIGCCLSRWSVC